MTPESQKLALLEWAGWKLSPHWISTMTEKHAVYQNGNELRTTKELPNLSSLDVLATFEEKLDEETLLNFFRCLEEVVDRAHGGKAIAFAVGRAKPAHILEALVRTLGLWREEG